MEQHETDINDLGLAADLEMLKRKPVDRRKVLKMGALGIGLLLTGGGALSAAAQGSNSTFLPSILTGGSTATPTAAATATTNPTATATTTATTECVSEIPSETAGPYPADGSRNVNVLTKSGIVRSDIRTSLGTGNTAAGIPTTVILTLVDASGACVPLSGYALYAWHCDRAGNYSMYSNGVTDEDYLRGVQASASDGTVRFTTIFPACYSGRWPHIHFEVYQSLATATSASNVIHTSQLALPEDVCNTVYATAGYEQSANNMARISLETDNVFRDGSELQMATVSGDVTNGYTVRLTVGIDV